MLVSPVPYGVKPTSVLPYSFPLTLAVLLPPSPVFLVSISVLSVASFACLELTWTY